MPRVKRAKPTPDYRKIYGLAEHYERVDLTIKPIGSISDNLSLNTARRILF